MEQIFQKIVKIPDDLAGLRLDQALAQILPNFSRTQIQQWIKNENVLVDKKKANRRQIVIGGEEIIIHTVLPAITTVEAENISLNIIFEDDHVLVINKPAGLVVHPGAGNVQHTLVNGLLYHSKALQQLPRAGIVHRLDKNTSGLLIVAKSNEAYLHLSKQLKSKSVKRIYQAIVYGVLTGGGMIDAPVGRHPLQRKKMAVIETGKDAITHYRLIEKFGAFTHVKVQLETGRTHQIRVHFAHTHHPLLGDQTYGGRLHIPKKASAELINELRHFKRQALHASEITFIHPHTLEEMTFTSPLPEDMVHLIKILKKDLNMPK